MQNYIDFAMSIIKHHTFSGLQYPNQCNCTVEINHSIESRAVVASHLHLHNDVINNHIAKDMFE